MSEEVKKGAQDVELNPEELDKVAGGIHIGPDGELYGDLPIDPFTMPKCPYCGSEDVTINAAWKLVCKSCNREFEKGEA